MTTYPTTESTSSSSLVTTDVRLNKSQYDPSSEHVSVCVATVAIGNGRILISLSMTPNVDDTEVDVVEQHVTASLQKLQQLQAKTDNATSDRNTC